MRSAMAVQLEKNASEIFWMLMPWGPIFSMAKCSCADKTILFVKMLTNKEKQEAQNAEVSELVGHPVLRIGKQNNRQNYTKSQHHVGVWVTTRSKTKNWKQSEEPSEVCEHIV